LLLVEQIEAIVLPFHSTHSAYSIHSIKSNSLFGAVKCFDLLLISKILGKPQSVIQLQRWIKAVIGFWGWTRPSCPSHPKRYCSIVWT